MELERHYIERRDFPPARRGYDPDEVDRHLRAIAEAVEQLKDSRPAQPTTVAGVAAERVQAIVEVAEASAREIEERAHDDARHQRTEAEKAARETRERADAQAAEHVRRAEEVADQLQARAVELQQQVGELLQQLNDAAGTAIESLRSGSGTLRSELQSMRSELASVRDARGAAPAPVAQPQAGPEATVEQDALPVQEIRDTPKGAGEPVEEPGPPDAEPEVVEEAVEQAREAGGDGGRASEGARLIALNMALSGTPREETARYLRENFDLADQEDLLDEVYARAGG